MSQDDGRINLVTSVGYLLKEASSALRSAMEDALRPFDMTVTHYSCMELLAQRPGLSNSDLARGTFVTRQSMNVVLHTLEERGYVTRPSKAKVGKTLPAQLTPLGKAKLHEVSAAIKAVENRMLDKLTPQEQTEAFRLLHNMVQSLR